MADKPCWNPTVLTMCIGCVGLAARVAAGGYTGLDLYPLTFPGPHSFNLVYIGNEVAAGGQVVVATSSGNNPDHAIVWDAQGNSIDLIPVGFDESEDFATNGTQQVGFARDAAHNGFPHAFFWNGSPQSGVDLSPTNLPGFPYSVAEGTNGTQQVGTGAPSNTAPGHALLWNGTAASAVDLNPTGFDFSRAIGTDGTHQVGEGAGPTTGARNHAIIWSGTAGSAVDLHPAGYLLSAAQAVSGNQVVGVGYLNDTQGHALLWTGGAGSAVDLNPSQLGINYSIAFGTNGARQVGEGSGGFAGPMRALVWSGSAGSAVDLHALLLGNFIASTAYSIDATGNIFGLATDANGNYHAVEWAVPEPSALALFIVAVAALRRRRRHV